MSGIHDGHRQRIRDRLKTGGIECFQEHEVLEWLLYCCIPRGDVNPLAHQLINAFGSLAGVLEADCDSLMSVPGIGESTALFISNYLSVYKFYQQSKQKSKSSRFMSLDEMAESFRVRFIGCKEEELHAMLLGSNLTYIRDEVISKGSVGSVQLNMRRLTEACLSSKAMYVVLAHNHPSNILLPSDSDVRTTINVAEVLTRLDVRLLDHLIVGSDDYTSMARSQEYSYIFHQKK